MRGPIGHVGAGGHVIASVKWVGGVRKGWGGGYSWSAASVATNTLFAWICDRQAVDQWSARRGPTVRAALRAPNVHSSTVKPSRPTPECHCRSCNAQECVARSLQATAERFGSPSSRMR